MKPDLAAFFVCVLGVVVAIAALQSPLGTPAEMGPGFFPFGLGCLLVLLGLLIQLASNGNAGLEPGKEEAAIPWRGVALVTAAPLVFVGTVNPLGLPISIFVVSILSCCASKRARLTSTIVFSFTLSALCALVFVVGLGLELPLLGTVFTGG